MLPHHGPGRPPRSPLGLLRAFIVMRMKEIRSLRELARFLDVDPRMSARKDSSPSHDREEIQQR